MKKVEPIADPLNAIGKSVFKPSGKPFKSGRITNTVKGVTVNTHTKLEAFTFVEDDSIVDVRQCRLVKTW